MITLYRTDKSVIGEFQVDSVKKAVKHAVRQGISLEWADLMGANLVGANLEWADFEGANLAFASLEDVSLAFANLVEASLEGANLSGASLVGANLIRATLDYAAVSFQCKSTDAIIDDRFVAQLVHLLTRQDHSKCSEEVKKEIEQIKSMSLTNLFVKYRDDVKPI